MEVPAWAIVAWPEVFATVEELEEAVAHMRPLGTSLEYSQGRPSRRQGQAMWGGQINGRDIGIAWDWAEVMKSVVALSDPTRVITNVILTDTQGRILDDDSCLLQLNGAIHGLPWQEQVLHGPARRSTYSVAA